MFLSGENKKAPVYVGAICCQPEQEEISQHLWMLTSSDKVNPLAQESGITTLNSDNNNELFALISTILTRFEEKLMSEKKYRISDTAMPEIQKSRSSKLLRKYNKGAARAQPAKSMSVNRRRITQDDRAKSLNKDDARLVKGMLKRGDIPQHIAQYFV